MAATKSSASRAQMVHDSLRRDILSGTLQPGSPLRLQALAAKYEVSMSVVREALTRLVEHHLVALETNRGFRVVDVSRADLLEISELLKLLAGRALEKSIRLGDLQWQGQVVSAHHVLEHTPRLDDDGTPTEEWVRAHAEFHDALGSACGSPRLLDYLRTLMSSSEFYQRLAGTPVADMAEEVIAEDRELMELATARKTREAGALLDKHIQRSMDWLLEHLFGED
ncbi:GntR family transcriptional regulator [Amycolatopsis pithecellobii]|uniref:GntR family transcriptional regulator n=1 Tax=Amycolatopsis pithecellobii TaxID=664692 RepID=A0A6N7ZAZ3_9PSEU|nr:GntR family transcriptional regulator [Amycolatopsis pithecellobii]MTD58900.1 GntR family transcriptional regulator [Amycolatopsis pithecellobii]